MSREVHGPVERLSNRSALLMGAVLVGGLVELGRSVHVNIQHDVTGVESFVDDTGPSFIFLRGCGENYLEQAPIYSNRFKQYGSLHFPYQTQGKHSQKIIDEGIIEACVRDGDRDRVFVPTSMGLMNMMNSLVNPDVQEAIGDKRLKGIIIRSGITSKANLQPAMQKAASWSARIPSLALVGDGWHMQRKQKIRKNIPHSPAVLPYEAVKHYESSANMPFPLVRSQHAAIHLSQPWHENSHAAIADEHPEMKMFLITADYDGVADWESTVASTEASFGRSVEVIRDHRRPHGSHADDIEFPEPLDWCMAELSGRHSHMLAAVTNLVTYRHNRQLADVS